MSNPAKDFIDEIDATAPNWGTVALWWLGQSGFLLKSETFTIVIDPYLSEHLTTQICRPRTVRTCG